MNKPRNFPDEMQELTVSGKTMGENVLEILNSLTPETLTKNLPYLISGITTLSNVVSYLGNIANTTKDYGKYYAGIDKRRHLIDEVRDYIALDIKGDKRISPQAKVYYRNLICNKILGEKMGVKDINILKEVSKGITVTEDVRHFTRAVNVLNLMCDYGIKENYAIEFLKGAHFIIKDEGLLYEELSKIPGAEPRFSSHFAATRLEEKGLHRGRIIPEILFLNTFDPNAKDKKPKESHFQVESSPWRGANLMGVVQGITKNPQTLEHIPHSMQYGYRKYKTSKKEQVENHGAYGWSVHNDANPIILDPLAKKTKKRR